MLTSISPPNHPVSAEFAALDLNYPALCSSRKGKNLDGGKQVIIVELLEFLRVCIQNLPKTLHICQLSSSIYVVISGNPGGWGEGRKSQSQNHGETFF